MRKFLKFIVLVNVLIIISTLGAFYYVNSDSFGHLVQGRISEELGNPVSFDRLKIHSNGDVTIKGLKVLALDQTTLLTIARVEVELKFSDLLSSDYLPQEIRVFDVDLDLKVKNNNWPLAILNKEKKLPPSPNFYAKVETLNLHLTKQNAELKAYAVKLDLLSAAVEKVPVISSLSTKGVVSERQLKFNSVKFGIFSGVVESVVSVLLTEKQAVKEAVVDVDLKEIDLSEVAQFAKLAPFQVLGNLEGDAKIGFNSKKLTVDADLTTGALSMTGTGVEKVLSLLKKGEKTLSFKSAHVKLKGSNEAVLFTKLEL
ncbi:MAG: hypothetical protein KAG26_09240, partial [Methylococcales bacterium]|nr:hypothetical protein [Methylococcales bacterium]